MTYILCVYKVRVLAQQWESLGLNGCSPQLVGCRSVFLMHLVLATAGDDYTEGAARRTIALLYAKLEDSQNCEDSKTAAMHKLSKVERSIAAAKSDVVRHQAALSCCL